MDSAHDLFDEEDFVYEIDKFRVDLGETRVWVMHRKKKQKIKRNKDQMRVSFHEGIKSGSTNS
jgi:hypothetical protein